MAPKIETEGLKVNKAGGNKSAEDVDLGEEHVDLVESEENMDVGVEKLFVCSETWDGLSLDPESSKSIKPIELGSVIGEADVASATVGI